MSGSLSMGVVFRGCVDREGVILSIDETADTVGRAGMPLRNLIAPAGRDAVDALLQDTGWPGIVIRPVRLHTDAAATLVAAAARRLVDVALLPATGGEHGIGPAAELLRGLLEDTDDGVWVLGADGTTVLTNARMDELLGTPAANLAERLGGDNGVPEPGTPWQLTLRLQHDGPQVELTGVPLAEEAGPIGTLVRASVPQRAVGEYARLARVTLHDPLTGLPGRVHLLDRLEGIAGEPGAGIVAVLRCAVDGFAIINDTHGQDTGDDVLVQIADRLCGLLGPQDYLARLGGDEFVLVRTGLASSEDAGPLAERLLGAFADPFPAGSASLEVFASIGLVTFVPDAGEIAASTLLDRAETAVREVKSASLAGGWVRYTEG